MFFSYFIFFIDLQKETSNRFYLFAFPIGVVFFSQSRSASGDYTTSVCLIEMVLLLFNLVSFQHQKQLLNTKRFLWLSDIAQVIRKKLVIRRTKNKA